MTRILYGYAGEGSGHSSRTREMAVHLQNAGHKVRLASYDRGFENLCNDFDVIEIEGLTIASSDNRVSRLATIRDNLLRLPAGMKSLDRLKDVFHQFRPNVVISDFEPMTAYLAEHYQVPLISLDNQHRMRYVEFQVPAGSESQANNTKMLIRAMIPWPSVSLVIAFTPGSTTNDRTFIFPPIVKKAVRNALPTEGDHHLVYLTSGYDSLISILKSISNQKFHVYGYNRRAVDGNLEFFENSTDGFVAHLASAQSVIATAGFTLISEALYLRKPYFALPMVGQFEQELNGWQLRESGYGNFALAPSRESIVEFIHNLDNYRTRLDTYERDDGSRIAKKLLSLVANDAALAWEFKRSRR